MDSFEQLVAEWVDQPFEQCLILTAKKCSLAYWLLQTGAGAAVGAQ